jgi:hypothetical protein
MPDYSSINIEIDLNQASKTINADMDDLADMLKDLPKKKAEKAVKQVQKALAGIFSGEGPGWDRLAWRTKRKLMMHPNMIGRGKILQRTGELEASVVSGVTLDTYHEDSVSIVVAPDDVRFNLQHFGGTVSGTVPYGNSRIPYETTVPSRPMTPQGNDLSALAQDVLNILLSREA